MKTVGRPWGSVVVGDEIPRTAVVSDGRRAYRILTDDAVSPEIDSLARTAPRPCEATDGALLRFVASYGDTPDGIGDHVVVQVLEAKDKFDPTTEAGSYYVLRAFGGSEALKIAAEPRFKLAAVDDTRCWVDDVTNVTGRIQSVYLYDENEHVHCCEVTPSHWMEFMYNAPENLIGDGDDERPAVPGFDSATAFEYENGGEHGCYMHVGDVERLDEACKHDCGPVNPKDLEQYRCAPEDQREAHYRRIREAFREHFDQNRVFEGHFEKPTAIGFV